MFTGIVETKGEIRDIITAGTNKSFWIASSISGQLRVDQSLCHDGVCLTVEEISGDAHRVTAISETLHKTTLDEWAKGNFVNLERSLVMNGRLDGHIVQGHVDSTATCVGRKEIGGSWEFQFEIPKKFALLVIEKGSICINGVSLTIFDVKKKNFRVAIIPYTYEHTNLQSLKPGDSVNVEFDIIGKYVNRSVSVRQE
ncbi:MAG: riboflavin synthase [Bacteroidetes bacterium]|nr:MAG: riboflavin synthase [Bacteroidota bacterium]